MTDDEICDVLCIGSGAGGLSAAITAGHAGAKVIVVEKASKLGGSMAYSGGQIWAGATHLSASAGVADSLAETTDYIDFIGRGEADPALRDVFVSRSPEALEFLCRRGLPLTVVRRLPDYYYPLAPGSKAEGRIHEIEPWPIDRLGDFKDRVALSPYGSGWLSSQDRVDAGGQAPTAELASKRAEHIRRGERCAGAGLAAAMVKAALAGGVTFYIDMPATKLDVDGDRVVGAIVTGPDGPRRIRALSGVVLATGGYDWHPELTREWEGIDETASMAPSSIEGDHLALASALDAAVVTARKPDASGVLFGFHTPGDVVDGRPAYRYYVPGLPHSIVVNGAGRRFADDSFHPSLIEGIARPRLGGPANWPAWVIVDQAFVEKYPLGALSPGAEVPARMAASAPTIRELASGAGIDAKGLSDEIERFKALCRGGSDTDFGRGTRPYTLALNGDARMPNPNLGALETPPFYAVRLSRVGLNGPAAGLLVDADSRVRTRRGGTIDGLFAAGNATAQTDIGSGYNSGIGNQRGLLQGYLAARAMIDNGGNAS